jgi:hypothetical protein
MGTRGRDALGADRAATGLRGRGGRVRVLCAACVLCVHAMLALQVYGRGVAVAGARVRSSQV